MPHTRYWRIIDGEASRIGSGMTMMELMRCLPLRTAVRRTLLAAVFVLLGATGTASAATDPATVRPDTIPALPANTTASDQPVDVLPARSRESVQAGIMKAAVRDFTSGGVTIGREVIATFDDPAFGPEILNGFTNDLGAPAIEGDGYAIWRGQVSADGTMALNGIGVTGGDGVVYLALAATVDLTDDQLRQIADTYRPRLAAAPGAATSDGPGGSGSVIVNILVILFAAGMATAVYLASRRPSAGDDGSGPADDGDQDTFEALATPGPPASVA